MFSMDPVGTAGRENWPESTVSFPEGVVMEIPQGESVWSGPGEGWPAGS